MEIYKLDGYYLACFYPNQLANLLVYDFTLKFLKGVSNPRNKDVTVRDFILNSKIESRDYEYYVALFDLNDLFEKECQICYRLNNKFDLNESKINTIDDLIFYREEFPDVTIKYKGKYFEFELKRYTGKLDKISIYNFIYTKIIKHYSGKTNYLILLQGKPGSSLSVNMFKGLHKKLKTDMNLPGYLGLSFNNDNKEMILIRIFPELNQFRRPWKSGSEMLTEIVQSKNQPFATEVS